MLEEGVLSSASWPTCNPDFSVYIVDVMLLLRKTPAQHYCKSFGELVDDLAYIMRQFTHAHTAICVFGVYGEDSDVKAYERRRRSTTTPRHYEVLAGASLPTWNTP